MSPMACSPGGKRVQKNRIQQFKWTTVWFLTWLESPFPFHTLLYLKNCLPFSSLGNKMSFFVRSLPPSLGLVDFFLAKVFSSMAYHLHTASLFFHSLAVGLHWCSCISQSIPTSTKHIRYCSIALSITTLTWYWGPNVQDFKTSHNIETMLWTLTSQSYITSPISII